MRDIISLACNECKRRNYSTTKNKKKTSERLEFSKFCRFCRKHTAASRNEVVVRCKTGASEAKRPTGAERAGEAASERRCRGVRGAKPLGR